MEDIQSIPTEKGWKKVILWIIGVLLGIFGILLCYFLYYTGFFNKSVLSYGLSCKISGGSIETYYCGSACWSGYPITQSERIKKETTPEDIFSYICPAVCQENTYCTCPKGKYFGSVTEGCIDVSEQRAPSKQDQDAFDRKQKQKTEEMLQGIDNIFSNTGEESFDQ